MKVVASLAASGLSGNERFIDICVGDATEPDSPVDILCVSAFPNDYLPMPGGLVGALHRRQIDVAALALDKAYDWRDSDKCWVSKRLPGPVKQLLCFEHAWGAPMSNADQAPSLVGNIFRAISELVLTDAKRGIGQESRVLERVRVPLLASGDQGSDKFEMLGATIRQAYIRLVAGLPVKRIEIVLYDRAADLHALLVHAGRALEHAQAEWAAYSEEKVDAHAPRDFDFFVSYRQIDRAKVAPVIGFMEKMNPKLRFFIDREQLSPGRYWKPDLVRGLTRSNRALCFITDTYPDSPECMDEFHAALCIAKRREQAGFLRPINMIATRKKRLPDSMSSVHWIAGANTAIEELAREALKE